MKDIAKWPTFDVETVYIAENNAHSFRNCILAIKQSGETHKYSIKNNWQLNCESETLHDVMKLQIIAN